MAQVYQHPHLPIRPVCSKNQPHLVHVTKYESVSRLSLHFSWHWTHYLKLYVGFKNLVNLARRFCVDFIPDWIKTYLKFVTFDKILATQSQLSSAATPLKEIFNSLSLKTRPSLSVCLCALNVHYTPSIFDQAFLITCRVLPSLCQRSRFPLL